MDWLRADRDDLLDVVYRVPDTVALERIDVPTEDGWSTTVRRLHRGDGPGWQHELDELTAALLAGCRGVLPMNDLLELLAAAHGEDPEALRASARPLVEELVRHGMLEASR